MECTPRLLADQCVIRVGLLLASGICMVGAMQTQPMHTLLLHAGSSIEVLPIACGGGVVVQGGLQGDRALCTNEGPRIQPPGSVWGSHWCMAL